MKNKEEEKKKKKREPFYLPHWMVYFAWTLNLVVIFGCALLVVFYGMTFGNKKSLEWLASVTIGLVSNLQAYSVVVFKKITYRFF